jgi:hypothetical protein
MEVIRSFEMPVHIRTTRHYISDNGNIHNTAMSASNPTISSVTQGRKIASGYWKSRFQRSPKSSAIVDSVLRCKNLLRITIAQGRIPQRYTCNPGSQEDYTADLEMNSRVRLVLSGAHTMNFLMTNPSLSPNYRNEK